MAKFGPIPGMGGLANDVAPQLATRRASDHKVEDSSPRGASPLCMGRGWGGTLRHAAMRRKTVCTDGHDRISFDLPNAPTQNPLGTGAGDRLGRPRHAVNCSDRSQATMGCHGKRRVGQRSSRGERMGERMGGRTEGWSRPEPPHRARTSKKGFLARAGAGQNDATPSSELMFVRRFPSQPCLRPPVAMSAASSRGPAAMLVTMLRIPWADIVQSDLRPIRPKYGRNGRNFNFVWGSPLVGPVPTSRFDSLRQEPRQS